MEYSQGEIQARLANERTLLAWVRTSLAFIALGIGLAKLSFFTESIALAVPGAARPAGADPSLLMGATLVAMGGVIAVVGAWRSRIWNNAIDPQGKPPENMSLGAIAALTALMSGVLFAYLLAS